MGSKPISPAMEPSNFSGRTKKGMALENSSAFKATDAARWDCERTKNDTKRTTATSENQTPRRHQDGKNSQSAVPTKGACSSEKTSCLARTCEAGAKAEAEANKRENTADFIMVRLENTETVFTQGGCVHLTTGGLLSLFAVCSFGSRDTKVQPDPANVTEADCCESWIASNHE